MAVKTFTTGEVLTAADTNTYLNNGGLVYIANNTATSGTTLQVDNCFSSTYEAYRIILSNVRLSGAAFITMQLRTTTTTATNYLFGRLEVPYNTATALGRGGTGAGTGSSWDIMVGTTTANGAWIDVFNPNLAQQTAYSASAPDPRTGGSFGGQHESGIQTDTTQFTGFILTAGATITNMKATVSVKVFFAATRDHDARKGAGQEEDDRRDQVQQFLVGFGHGRALGDEK